MNILAFTEGLTWAHVPTAVRERIAWLCLDIAAAAEAGCALDASAIAADVASTAMGGDAATILRGGRASAPGAAFANGTLMNAIDYDDGHALAKGHAGAVVIPAALAVAEAVEASHEDFLVAALIGYEVALRAAVQQHQRWPLFHSSGTWGAVGAAAAAGHLLKLSGAQMESALGLAEYHAPTDLIMRSVAEPTMAKDAMGWGAHVGVTAAMLAAAGFTGHRSEFTCARGADDLGETWQVMSTYVKPYPCCRWVHPGLAAVEGILATEGRIDPLSIDRITVRTFAAAANLARMVPETSEQAQFNLLWPIASYLATRRFGVASVTTALGDPLAADLLHRIVVVVDPEIDARFPSVRQSEVILTFSDGSSVSSGLCSARGDADDPQWDHVVRAKYPDIAPDAWSEMSVEPLAGPVSALTATDPLAVLTYPITIHKEN